MTWLYLIGHWNNEQLHVLLCILFADDSWLFLNCLFKVRCALTLFNRMGYGAGGAGGITKLCTTGWGVLTCCVRTRFVVLIGAWSTHAAPANKRFAAWSTRSKPHVQSFTSIYNHLHSFSLSFQHPLTVFFWPYSRLRGILTLVLSFLIELIRGALLVIFHTDQLGMRGASPTLWASPVWAEIRYLDFASSVPHICAAAEQFFGERLLRFVFNVFYLCVKEFAFLHTLYKETTPNSTNDFHKWWMGGFFFVFMCPFHEGQPNKGLI